MARKQIRVSLGIVDGVKQSSKHFGEFVRGPPGHLKVWYGMGIQYHQRLAICNTWWAVLFVAHVG